jgi:acyl-CoA synthetase (AMP-forming)/AMP-acid ligase II
MLNNTPEMFECHFGVPMCGAVLNTLNTRLDAEAIAFMLNHGEAKVLITDREYSPTMVKGAGRPGREMLVIDVDDPEYTGPGERVGSLDYEAFLAGGDPEFAWQTPADEWDAISLNYTSGTTGNPKGVVYHHRGAYLNAPRTSSPGACRRTRSICGRCRCSTATAGAFRGPWRPIPAPTSACAASRRRPSSMQSASTRSPTTAARRSCIRC